jgi:voltage-gated potassium channel
MELKKGEGRASITLRLMWRRLKYIGPTFIGVYFAVATSLYLLENGLKDTKFEKFGDALWFCVVTMSTVGYGDVYPISPAGRVITGFFIVFTLGTLGLLITAVSEAVVEVNRMEEHGLLGTQMENHVILCGYNSMAKASLIELLAAGRGAALLCETPEELMAARDEHKPSPNFFVTSGEPSQALFRERLNAEKAAAVIVAMSDDAKNLIAALNVKVVNPAVRLVVALQREELRQTLEAGGVTYIASPNELSGRLVASAAFEPEVASLLEDLMSGAIGTHDMQQYRAGDLGGRSVSEIRKELDAMEGPLLVAIAKKEGGKYAVMPHPSGGVRVEKDDEIILMCDNAQAEKLTSKYKLVQGR